jgi:hypothetical protein
MRPSDGLARPWLGAVLGLAAPVALTAILLRLQVGQSRDYVFVYLAVVGLLGLFSGLLPSLRRLLLRRAAAHAVHR